VIDVEGWQPLQLTYESGDNEAPSWSPDGSLIVFSSTREGPSRIYVMTASGTDQRRLLVLNGEQTNPKWSMNDLNN
jgi:TolB protein